MFKRSLLSRSIAASIALASVPMLAQAQEAEEPLLEEIVVTGIRASLNQAIDIKRDSMQVMDSIVAEDIGKLPDNNVVESLQRVAGVQVTDRAGGEVSGISIRGLTDISTTINGRTIFTAANRSVSLQDIPATLVSRIDVIKSRSASQYENGIAGQIDIHTFRPFDFDGSKVSVAARGIYQEEAEKVDPTISALVSNRWDTSAGDFGALLNVSYTETNYRDQSVTAGAQLPFFTENPPAGFNPLQRIRPTMAGVAEDPIWEVGQQSGLPTAPGSTLDINGEPAEYYLSRDAIFQADLTGQRERPAANVSLQWAPNDRSEYVFEAFYNGYRNESFNNLLFGFVDYEGAIDNPESSFELYEGTNVIKSRTVGAPYVFTSGDLTVQSTDSYLYALGGDWDLTDDLNVKSEVVYQESTFESEFTALRGESVRHEISANFSGVPGFSFGNNPATPDVDESDLTDPSQWTLAQFYDNEDRNEGSAVTFTTDAEYSTGWDFVHTFDFGVRYDDRDATEFHRDQFADACAIFYSDDTCRPGTYEGIGHVNSEFFDGNNTTVPSSWFVPGGQFVEANKEMFLDIYSADPDLDPNQALAREFDINEKNLSLYGTATFETEAVGGKLLDGELGFRYVDVQTDMSFGGSDASSDVNELLTDLALRYHFTDQLMARFSYAETLRMPDFVDLNANITYLDDVTDIGYGTANGGNPDLEPTTSQNYDLSLEYYFGDASSAYVTLFRRDIEGLVVTFRNRIQEEIPGYTADTFILQQPDNASEAMLEGAEVGFVYFPENLPGILDGFGVQSSFTFLDSSQTNPVTNSEGEVTGYEEGPMFGVSDSSYSITAAYERDKFDARLSYIWRDDFLYDNEAPLFANPITRFRDEQTSLDFQLSYRPVENLTLTLDGTNLTEEVYQSRYGNSYLHTFGSWQISRTFALGARYSF